MSISLEEAVAQIEPCEYDDLSKWAQIYLEQHGLVSVCGASDDLLEMRGAYFDEFGAWGGVRIVSSAGRRIKAIWNSCNDGRGCWIFETDIPHADFRMMEDGELYCRGLVFEAIGGETWAEESA